MVYRNRNFLARKREPLQENRRRGLAVTELAVCIPVLVLIMLGTIESCAMIFLQQSLSIAAYEGARISLVPDATSVNVKYQSELILQDRGIIGSTVTVTPASFETAAEGTWISVEASAPFNDNSLVGGWIFSGRTLTATVEMMKEH